MASKRRQTSAATPLIAEPLTASGFAPFGDVIVAAGDPVPINQGKGWRYPDLAALDLDAEHGHAAISRVTCEPESMPVPLRVMERHPLGTQAFVPLDHQRFLVVVAPAGEPPSPETFQAFIAEGHQGINYHRGVWHHPMIALNSRCEFLEVHRAGPGTNCDEMPIDVDISVTVASDTAVSS